MTEAKQFPSYRKPETYITSSQFASVMERLEALEAAVSGAGQADEKAGLIKRANELGLGAPSILSRWSVEKLTNAIAEAQDA